MNKIGKLGEDIAVRFLKKRGFSVLSRNYLKKQGEIDIVATKAGIYHFIEVKAVSREIINNRPIKGDFVEPEENMHRNKIRRLRNSIEIYLQSNHVSPQGHFLFSKSQDSKENKVALTTYINGYKFDLCVIYIDESKKKACVKFLEDLPLSVERF
ncbi:MAG: YraN family protein [Candidatus Paceibacterota bacterium]